MENSFFEGSEKRVNKMTTNEIPENEDVNEKGNKEKHKHLSEMKSEVASAMASDVFTDIIGPLTYYLPRIADDAKRDKLEHQRSALGEKIRKYFNEDDPLIPSGGFVSIQMEQELKQLREATSILIEEINIAYNKDSMEIGRRVEKKEEPSMKEVDNFEISGNTNFNDNEVRIDPRPTRVMLVDERELGWKSHLSKNRERTWAGFLKKILGRRNKKTVPVKTRKPVVDPRPTRVNMPKWEERVDNRSTKSPSLERNEKTIFQIETAVETYSSPNHPETNQDTYLEDKERKIFGVFDGMGGKLGGEVAALTAEKIAYDYISRKLDTLHTVEEAKNIMQETIEEINRVLLFQQEHNEDSKKEMGTTATISFIFEGKLIIGQIGDSRLYLHRNNKLIKITKDDSYIPEGLQQKFDKINNPERELTKEELEHWKSRNMIKQALGVNYEEPKVEVIDIEKGDKLLLTTDGVHDNLTKKELGKYLRESDLEGLTKRAYEMSLIDYEDYLKNPNLIFSRRNKFDDITAILIKLS